MNKKVILVVLAVLAFFAGQIWLESALAAVAAPKTFAAFLVPVFELVAGGFLGFFWCKHRDELIMDHYETQYCDVRAEMIHLENELNTLKKSKAAKTSSKKSTNKVS